jgi:hypothetical protein
MMMLQMKEQNWLNKISLDKGADSSTVSLLGQRADGSTGLGQMGSRQLNHTIDIA